MSKDLRVYAGLAAIALLSMVATAGCSHNGSNAAGPPPPPGIKHTIASAQAAQVDEEIASIESHADMPPAVKARAIQQLEMEKSEIQNSVR
jgi:hypothetical protein